ncbi:hypothetical protein V1504DRAFT_55983 [Lipomyces starkeyi]
MSGLIFARDGPISPIGKAIDRSAPEDLWECCPLRVVEVEAAHIIPFMVSKHSTMQTQLSMFADTNMESILRGKNINSSSNIFCTDHDTHLLFDEFVVGVKFLNGQYWLRKVVPKKAVGPFLGQCQDGEEIIFGTGPQGHEIDLPDGELFNIHLAIGRVLHASGAGEIINKILRDEEDYNDGIVEDGASAARIAAFALRMALNKVQAVDSVESPPDFGGDSNKQCEGGTAIKLSDNLVDSNTAIHISHRTMRI